MRAAPPAAIDSSARHRPSTFRRRRANRGRAVGRVALEAAERRIEFEQAVNGLGFAAGRFAQPLGGPARRGAQVHSAGLAPAKISRMPRTIVVLPTPGPPVMTSTFSRVACADGLALRRPPVAGPFFARPSQVPPRGRSPAADDALAQLVDATRHAQLGQEQRFQIEPGLVAARLARPRRRPVVRARRRRGRSPRRCSSAQPSGERWPLPEPTCPSCLASCKRSAGRPGRAAARRDRCRAAANSSAVLKPKPQIRRPNDRDCSAPARRPDRHRSCRCARPGRADAIRLQEHHDVAHRLLFLPALADALNARAVRCP